MTSLRQLRLAARATGAIDSDGPSADYGLQTGDVDVSGKAAISSAGDVSNALSTAKADGKHTVLMKGEDVAATKFVALSIG